MSAFPDVVIANKEYTMGVKTGQQTADERLPIAATSGVAAVELDLRVLIGDSPGAFIEFQVRNNGPMYIGMAKSATSGVTLTAGVASLGYCLKLTDSPGSKVTFWVSREMPFCEHIADIAATAFVYRRVNPNRKARDTQMLTGH